jgi:flavodoxin-like protein
MRGGVIVRAVVVYESMYGNTHLVADAIGDGLRKTGDVVVVPVDDAERHLVDGADLVIVGGPTHAHGMSRARTREAAAKAAHEPDSDLVLDPDAEGPGLREWFDSLGQITTNAAAFDTRLHMPAPITGRASKGIARRLRQHGFTVVTEPESFLVTKDDHLEVDEKTRALDWGARLATSMTKTEHGTAP